MPLARDHDNLSGIEVLSPEGFPLPARAERRRVELAGYLVRPDKKIVDIKIVDLSYDGCAVRTDVPLAVGELVKLTALGRNATSAIVRWYSGRKAGLQFETERKSKPHWPRKSERLAVQTQAVLRRAGRVAFPVRVFDITVAGCRCEFVDRPGISERVWIKLEGLAALEANVCWVEQSMVGLSFQRPLHPAVLDMLLKSASR
jgi:hypothetical protein